jgi:2-polyprenyl-3-methyl-5-hydroxy-6-metoxy-1,4-benzoquinol methylase
MSETRQSWDENAQFWVQIIRGNRDRYRLGLTNPAVQDAVGQVDGVRVLDAGCGEGYLSRFFANRGAEVTGIDSSADLIEAAKGHKLAPELPVSFDVGSVDALPYDAETFDLVLCNHVMNDLQDPVQAIDEFSRVLRPDGRIVIMMLHPCFYNKHAERGDQKNNLIASAYFQQRRVSQHFEVDGITSPAANTAWLRPLEYYTKSLAQAGFVITGLSEPHPSEQMIADDDWWRTSFSRPLFLLITAQKWAVR